MTIQTIRSARFVRSPADDWRNSTAWQLVIVYANRSQRHGPVVFASREPSRSEAWRMAVRVDRLYRKSVREEVAA